MATSTTITHTLSDGLQIYQKIWSPSSPPKAHLVLMHGFSDRVDHYDTFFNILLSSYPIRVVGWDRRGWGKSVHRKSDRGNTGTKEFQMQETNDYLNHIISVIDDLDATPLFLMGHSMGGQETAYYMLNRCTTFDTPDARPRFAGFILESPYIGLDAATEPSGFKVAAGKLAARLLPHFQLYNPVKVEYICPDPAVQKMYGDDPLCHGLGTLEMFRDMLQREHELKTLGNNPAVESATLTLQLPCPVLWGHGTADKATDYTASKELCDALVPCADGDSDKVFVTYDGWYHQLHNQPDGAKEQYARDVGEWVLKIASQSRGQRE